MHLLAASSAAKPAGPRVTVGSPGDQGVVTGTQGIGVSTPIAAAVAAATSGLACDMHMPKGGMFSIGAKSMIVAATGATADTVGAVVQISVEGGHALVAREHRSHVHELSRHDTILGDPHATDILLR